MYEVPAQLNTGPWLTAYTAPALKQRIERDTMVLPICSLGTPAGELEKLGTLVLPPLFHDALTPDLKQAIVARVRQCLPYYEGSKDRARSKAKIEVVELPRKPPSWSTSGGTVALSVDTAVEEHGPHLPLATDRIQSCAILAAAAKQVDGLRLVPPVDYGHLVWGLAYGLSVDIPPALLVPYVTRCIDALVDSLSPTAVYIVDVHGSPPHRDALRRAVAASKAKRKAFRWLHEPLTEWAWNRGDAHAGGVETAMIEHISRGLVDRTWWPARAAELQAQQMPQPKAMELAADMPRFIAHGEATRWNGIVGKIENYHDVNASTMFARAVATAVADVRGLLSAK